MLQRLSENPAYWIDAQLPPQLAPWLTETFDVPALSASFLGLRDATDDQIFGAAREAGAVIVSKDSDFLDRVRRLGSPPKLLWVTCGNTSTRHLKAVLLKVFPEAHALLSGREDVVEVSG